MAKSRSSQCTSCLRKKPQQNPVTTGQQPNSQVSKEMNYLPSCAPPPTPPHLSCPSQIPLTTMHKKNMGHTVSEIYMAAIHTMYTATTVHDQLITIIINMSGIPLSDPADNKIKPHKRLKRMLVLIRQCRTAGSQLCFRCCCPFFSQQ